MQHSLKTILKDFIALIIISFDLIGRGVLTKGSNVKLTADNTECSQNKIAEYSTHEQCVYFVKNCKARIFCIKLLRFIGLIVLNVYDNSTQFNVNMKLIEFIESLLFVLKLLFYFY